jgi:hypothetical protein
LRAISPVRATKGNGLDTINQNHHSLLMEMYVSLVDIALPKWNNNDRGNRRTAHTNQLLRLALDSHDPHYDASAASRSRSTVTSTAGVTANTSTSVTSAALLYPNIFPSTSSSTITSPTKASSLSSTTVTSDTVITSSPSSAMFAAQRASAARQRHALVSTSTPPRAKLLQQASSAPASTSAGSSGHHHSHSHDSKEEEDHHHHQHATPGHHHSNSGGNDDIVEVLTAASIANGVASTSTSSSNRRHRDIAHGQHTMNDTGARRGRPSWDASYTAHSDALLTFDSMSRAARPMARPQWASLASKSLNASSSTSSLSPVKNRSLVAAIPAPVALSIASLSASPATVGTSGTGSSNTGTGIRVPNKSAGRTRPVTTSATSIKSVGGGNSNNPSTGYTLHRTPLTHDSNNGPAVVNDTGVATAWSPDRPPSSTDGTSCSLTYVPHFPSHKDAL